MEKKILLNWNIKDVESIEKVDSFSNSVSIITSQEQRKYVLKRQQNLEKIKREAALLSNLREEVPIAAPMVTKSNNYFVEFEKDYYMLYPFLEGKSFTDHYTENYRREAGLLGETIGNLHSVLKDIDYKEGKNFNLVGDVRDWARNVIEQNKKALDYPFVREAIELFEKEFSPIYDLLPKQTIHRDIHPGNILFTGHRLSGIVDFELSVKGVRIFDPCYCSTSILVGNFDNEIKRGKWLNIFSSLLQAYNEKNTLTREERFGLFYVLCSIQIIFMAFSCNIEDFKAAKCNERVLKWLFENKKLIEERISAIP